MSNLIQAIHTRLQDDMGRAMANLMMRRYGLIVSVKHDKSEVSVDVINGVSPDDLEVDIIICKAAISAISKHLTELLAYYLDDEAVPEEERESYRNLYNGLIDNGL